MKLQASSISKYQKCSGSYHLEQNLPAEWQYNPWKDKGDYGTAVHALGEKALRAPKKMTVKQLQKASTLTGDELEKAVHCASVYDNYIRALVKKTKGQLIIEEKLRVFVNGIECVAKADALIMAGNDIHIIDLKSGSFDYTDSVKPQLLFGGLCSIISAYDKTKVRRVIGHVVQPSYYNVPEQAKNLGVLFEGDYYIAEQMIKVMAADIENFPDDFTPGDHCSFCRALPKCPKHTALALTFEGDSQPAIEMNIEKLDYIVRNKKRIEDFLKACESQAETLLRSGAVFPTLGIVQGKGHRHWIDPVLTVQAMSEQGITDIYEPAKLKTPAQLEKVAGKKNLETLVETPTTFKVGIVDNPFKAVK